MATERSLNPVAALVHLVALAAGLYLGWLLMGWVTPDLPGEGTDPGVSATATAEQVAGDDPNSLLRPDPLAGALDSIDDQLASGEGVAVLRIEPARIGVEESEADGAFEPSAVDPAVPERILAAIGARRPEVDGLEDVQYMELVATEPGPRWYVQIVSTDPRIRPPWTYTTDLDGPPPLAPGEAPPTPIE